MSSASDGSETGTRLGRVLVVEGEAHVEWRFTKADRELRIRIAQWGSRGLGGFTESGDDEHGGWIRRPSSGALLSLAKSQRLYGARALTLTLRLGEALTASEEDSLSIGPIVPTRVCFDSSGLAHLLIDRTLHALVGVDVAGNEAGSVDPAWMPPEQAEGEEWNFAAARYGLALIVYRAISGTHPFSGAGIRHALHASRQARTAPPFEASVAARLPPGLQSLVLSLLSPEVGDRPASAKAIVEACTRIVRGDDRDALTNASTVRPLWRRFNHAPRRTWGRLAWGPFLLVPVVLSAWATESRAPKSPPPVVAGELRPHTRTDSESCASCHTEEARQWRSSVMAHASRSPLFGALESAIEEQVGRSASCPNGAGVLRSSDLGVCRDPGSGLAITGTGGERWCVNCHAPGDNLEPTQTAWSGAQNSTRRPVSELLSPNGLEGVSCIACHTTVHSSGGSREAGNPSWRSPVTGNEFLARPEDRSGSFGIGNSGYVLDREVFFGRSRERIGEPIVHQRPPAATRDYLSSSEFCGACHDVRLFGTDVNRPANGEHFKRLRNAYSEWRSWADDEKRLGREPASCQGCHMSLYPGVCKPGEGGDERGCPNGTHFERRSPGSRPPSGRASHYFTSVDVPLTDSYKDSDANSRELDADGVPIGLRARRDMLLKSALRFAVEEITGGGSEIRVPITIENVGAGHRVPAGFSQEREVWVELIVRDARGSVVYEAGRIGRDDEDLHDKRFLRVTTSVEGSDGQGRPLGLFGADVADDVDAPLWKGSVRSGFFGRGLINLQNGFLRCVRCDGIVDADGQCQSASLRQGTTRAARFAEGDYDIDTGECRSNLRGDAALFETYFPIGALDSTRGIVKGPDAIVDTRSAAPGVPLRYVYQIAVGAHPAPFTATARLRFRSFPPFLVRAFADYEREQSRLGNRLSGPQVRNDMMSRIDIVDLASAKAVGP